MPAVATKELTLELPITVSEDEAKILFAVKLYEAGKVSLGQAARLAGFSKGGFMDILGRHKVPVFNYDAADLAKEAAP
jgi:predicted HTH domain antitoxin